MERKGVHVSWLRRNKHWAGSKQQDAQEFLSDILDAMNTEMGGGNVDKVPEGKASRGSLLRLLKRDKAEYCCLGRRFDSTLVHFCQIFSVIGVH